MAYNANDAPETWTLLRGILREHRHWGDFPNHLEKSFPGATLFCPDLPGNGEQYSQLSPTHIEEMVEAVRSQLVAKNITYPVNIIAISMGAMVATAWLHRYPKEVKSATLINTSMRPFSPFYHRLRPSTYLKLIQAFSSGTAVREEVFFDLTVNLSSKKQETVNRWIRYSDEYPVNGSNAFRQFIAASRFSGPNSVDRVPVLLLASRKDRLVNYQSSIKIAKAWKCPIVFHPDAGHDLPLDDPQWIIDQLSRWREEDH